MNKESYRDINELPLVSALSLFSALLALGIPFCEPPFIEVKPVKGEQYKVKVWLKGKFLTSSPWSNPILPYLKSGNSEGLTLVESITVDYGQKEYRSITIELIFDPNLTAY